MCVTCLARGDTLGHAWWGLLGWLALVVLGLGAVAVVVMLLRG